MKIAIGSDHAGFGLKEDLLELLKGLHHDIVDCGTHTTESVDYPDFGEKVSGMVSGGEVERGVGRILVPPNLRDFLGIQSGELVVAGQGDYFEVWTPADWKMQMDDLQAADANEQRFSTLDLSSHAVS